MKVKFFDKKLRTRLYDILAVTSTLASLLLIVMNIPQEYKNKLGWIGGSICFIIYTVLWLKANYIKKVIIYRNNTEISIEQGDIFLYGKSTYFTSCKYVKVINFNEYYDSILDDKIVAKSTLNGQFLAKYISCNSSFDNNLSFDSEMKAKIIACDSSRCYGKKERYKLGSIYSYTHTYSNSLKEEFWLVAFSRFTSENRAHLTSLDFISCLLHFWQEVGKLNQGKTVVIPLLGAGITVHDDYKFSHQEILEMIILSFKISQVRIPMPGKLVIIIHPSQNPKINFHKLKYI